MNNEYLRVNSKDGQDGIVEGVYETKIKEETESEKAPTIYSLLRQRDNTALNFQRKLPSLSKYLFTLLILISVVFLLFFLSFAVQNTDMLVGVAVFASAVLPIFICCIFYELNAFKNVSFGGVLGGIIVGIVYYFVISAVKIGLFELTARYEWLQKFIFTAIFDLGLILVSSIYVKLLKKVNLFASLLAVICVYAGFYFTNAFLNIYNSLFSATKIEGGQGAFAIVKSVENFSKTVFPFAVAILKCGVYESLLYFFWSVICGGVIALKVSPVKSVYKDGSLYFLIITQLVLHGLKNVGSMMIAVDVALNAICTAVSLIVAYKMLNFILLKSSHEKAQ